MSRNRPSCDDGRRLGHNGRAPRRGQCRSRFARQYAAYGRNLGRADSGVGTDLRRAFQSGGVAGDELAQEPSMARILSLRGRANCRRLHRDACRAWNVRVAVALYITAAYWFTASTSFANPAVTIARALTNSFSGIAPADVPMFIVAQFVGALAGLGVMSWFFSASGVPEHPAPLERT
jgi:Major intrinsic protein